MRIWRQPDGAVSWKCTAILEQGHDRTIRCVCWSPCGRYLATAGFDKHVTVWQHQSGMWEQVRGLLRP